MSSPITSEDFQPQDPAQPLCETFREKLLNNDKIAQFFSWFVDSDGNLAIGFLGDLAKFLFKVGTTRWSPVVETDNNPTTGQVWLECDGSVLNITDYPKLAVYLGSQFNEPTDNALLVFRTPKMNGRFMLARGDSATSGSSDHAIGTRNGAESSTIPEAALPPHKHIVPICVETTGWGTPLNSGDSGSTEYGVGKPQPTAGRTDFNAGTKVRSFPLTSGAATEPTDPPADQPGFNTMPPHHTGVVMIFAGFKVGGNWL